MSWLIAFALAQHSVTRTKIFSTRARPEPAGKDNPHLPRPAASSTRTRPARKAVRVPAPAPQMQVPAIHLG